jgi:putative Mn2+ efflux pump MntP
MTFHTVIHEAALFLKHNLQFVTFGITAVMITLIGPYINGTVKRVTASWHWIVRYILFVLLCTLGYGFLSHTLYSWMKKWFIHLPEMQLILWVAVMYLGLAWIAKQHNKI